MGIKRNEITVIDPHEPQAIKAECAVCGAEARTIESDHVIDGTLWGCGCGAIGLSCSPTDLDEAADQLTAHLGLEKTAFAQPRTPVGKSGRLTLQAYNSDQTLSEVLAFFPAHGFMVLHEEVETLYRYPGDKILKWFSWFLWLRKA